MGLYNWTDAKHDYSPLDSSNPHCAGGWYNDRGEYIRCNSTQRSSVLHFDDAADFRERHWHDGGDCMCFEGDDNS